MVVKALMPNSRKVAPGGERRRQRPSRRYRNRCVSQVILHRMIDVLQSLLLLLLCVRGFLLLTFLMLTGVYSTCLLVSDIHLL